MLCPHHLGRHVATCALRDIRMQISEYYVELLLTSIRSRPYRRITPARRLCYSTTMTAAFLCACGRLGTATSLKDARCRVRAGEYQSAPVLQSQVPDTLFANASCLKRSAPAVLWITCTSLRLADNGAVIAASRERCLLPVVTVVRAVLPRTIRAVRDLRRRLLKMNSMLVVRIVEHYSAQVDAVVRIARSIRARVVWTAGFAVREFNSCGVRLRARPDTLTEQPRTMPPLPTKAAAVHSDVSGTDIAGETVARATLTSLVRAGCGEAELRRLLQKDLGMGLLANERITAELRQFALSRSYCARTNLKYISSPDIPKAAPEQASQLTGEFMHRASSGTNKVLLSSSVATAAAGVAAYDVIGGDRRGVEWDEETKTFRLRQWEHTETERHMSPKERWREFVRRRRMFLKTAFLPDDVTPDYYSFTAWRVAQRCVSATVGVFGTQALLLALGVRSGRIGQAAAISWVLKDGLGRVGKMVWASGMGKDFDVDPKRWRFRSALLYAFGNGLEIVTQLFPASFLLFATAANSMKQVSMLTSSATRNAMYRSFGGKAQNIANITAKGEAQIVIADLIGMICGIRLSKVVGTSKANVLTAYSLLTLLDIFGIYMELRQVVFRTLNPERTSIVVDQYLKNGEILTPASVNPQERIFLKPRYKNRTRFSSIAKAANDPQELETLLKVFRREHYLVSMPAKAGSGPCRVVLRRDASNEDVLRALLTVGYVIKAVKESNGARFTREEEEAVLRNARHVANKAYAPFFKELRGAGWNTDNLLFGTLKRRGYWRRESTQHN